MLSCISYNKLTKGKNQRVPKIYIIHKKDGLWNRVEHWATYPTENHCASSVRP